MEPEENKSTNALSTENTFLASFSDALDKNVKYAGGYRPKYQQYEYGTYPTPHYTLSSAPWYRVFTMEMRQFCKHLATKFENEISCYFRNGIDFPIFTQFYHFAPLVKCTSGYRLYVYLTFLTIFKRYIGPFGGRPNESRISP